MKTDLNGCSTCPQGTEQHETFTRAGKKFVQYDFRKTTGELFSCVAATLREARIRRDTWLTN
jgi:hypothetical protein